MNKIQKLSGFFKWVFAIIFLGWPIMLLLIWFQDQNSFLVSGLGFSTLNFIPGNIASHILEPLSFTAKVWGFMVSCIPAMIGMIITFSLMRLFKYYQQGKIFTLDNIRQIKRVGLTMLAWAILNPIYQVLMSLVVTLQNPVGQRVIAINLDTDYFRNLITAGIVFVIAYIMQEGVKLREEQALTV